MNSNNGNPKEKIIAAVDAARSRLIALSHDIHQNPELGFQEYKAVRWQTELLKEYGFSVEVPYAGLETAYRATISGRPGGPRVAILAEYDALPGVGHGCGHNIMAACAVGAGIGLAAILPEVAGEVVVMGTPAEEGGGGKVFMVERGAFSDIDFAMMMHPSTRNIIGRGGRAAVSLTIEFRGKAVHSSGPEKGINALAALIQVFSAINSLHQRWKISEGPNTNGIITAGGTASNIVPDYAAAKFTCRANTRKYLLKMIEDIKQAVQAAALLTGAQPKVDVGLLYAERYPNLAMGEAFKANMAVLGEVMNYPDPQESIGSSDVGNVTLVVPTIHEYLAIAPESVNAHTEAFREAAVSPRGDEVVILAAKGLAMTAYDLLSDAALQERVKAEFREKVKGS